MQLITIKAQAAGTTVEATLNTLGARQVSLKHNGRDALQPYDLSQTPPFATGFVMAPWANRMRDGQWISNGKVHQNPVNEARTNTALHGLLMDTVYDVTHQTENSLTLSTTIQPSDGYPFEVATSVTYTVTIDGLTVTHEAVNHSADAAPFQTGAHPYLYIDGIATADLEIRVPADSWWQVDDRLLPIGLVPVDGTNLDARQWRRLGDYCIDNGYTDLKRDANSVAVVELRAPQTSGDPRQIQLWQDGSFRQVHIFSTPLYPSGEAGKTVHGITVEPVTAGPDAFNTGADLIELSTGQKLAAQWGIRLLNW